MDILQGPEMKKKNKQKCFYLDSSEKDFFKETKLLKGTVTQGDA